jgi:predicted aminopeptidase
MRERKQRILDELRRDYTALKVSWNGSSEYDLWFDREINNAKLNSVAAYYDLVPGFERLLADCRGDLKTFYAEARKLSKKSRKERHQWLKNLASVRGSEAPPNDRFVLSPQPHQMGAQSDPAAPAIPGG